MDSTWSGGKGVYGGRGCCELRHGRCHCERCATGSCCISVSASLPHSHLHQRGWSLLSVARWWAAAGHSRAAASRGGGGLRHWPLRLRLLMMVLIYFLGDAARPGCVLPPAPQTALRAAAEGLVCRC